MDDFGSELSLAQRAEIDNLADRFEAEFEQRPWPKIEEYLARQPELGIHLLKELLTLELQIRRSKGENPQADEYRERFPKGIHVIEAVLSDDVTQAVSRPKLDEQANDKRQPELIGRYVVRRILGRGGFGVVYLAYDQQLARFVAIKVPHARLVSRREDAELYLAEARMVANLDHPNIVPVHDVGSAEHCPCFIVTKFVEGTDLQGKLKRDRLGYKEAAELVATLANALHYAHQQGLVHRDVKPGNILIDRSGKPFLVDFGLALREQDVGRGPRYAGTPAYMSPEQSRGEGHRVDGRSDIFSLGVVLYQLLVGRLPFRGNTVDELLEQIRNQEPKPPRQIDDAIPKELEQVCL